MRFQGYIAGTIESTGSNKHWLATILPEATIMDKDCCDSPWEISCGCCCNHWSIIADNVVHATITMACETIEKRLSFFPFKHVYEFTQFT